MTVLPQNGELVEAALADELETVTRLIKDRAAPNSMDKNGIGLSAYGDWSNWVLGAILCNIGAASILGGTPSAIIVPFLIAAIESVFGCWLCWFCIAKEQADDFATTRSDG